MSHWATNTVFLAAAYFIAGIIGFFYRLFLSKELGPQGMGIYQQTLAFYTTAITIITAGIPLSVSKLVAENRKTPKTIGATISAAYMLTAFFSLIGSIYLIILSMTMRRPALLLILPASILVGLSSVLKGYFLGMQHTTPVQWSLLCESLVRAVLGAFFVKSALLIRLELETRGAVTALAIGELVSLLVLLVFFDKRCLLKRGHSAYLENIKKILHIAIPVSLSQIISSMSGSAEALLVPKSLSIAGLSASDALAMYGKTSGMVLPLLFFPAIIIMSLSSNIIPQIARALSQKNTAYAFKLSEQALIFSTFFSFSVTAVFISLAKPIGELLFKGFELDKLIICFAAGIPFFYTENILRALLRGTGNNQTPLINSCLSFVVTNGILYLLVTNPFFGIFGYTIALITSSAISILISFNALEKKFNMQFNMLDVLIKPLLCCIFMVYILSKTYNPLISLGLPKILCLGADVLLGFTGYLILALALGLDIKSYKKQ